MTLEDLQAAKPALSEICIKYQVARLYAFGSVVTGEAGPGSDLDFIVQFATDSIDGAFMRYMSLKEDLEALFGCPVDLLTLKPFRNRVFQAAVDIQKTLVYAA